MRGLTAARNFIVKVNEDFKKKITSIRNYQITLNISFLLSITIIIIFRFHFPIKRFLPFPFFKFKPLLIDGSRKPNLTYTKFPLDRGHSFSRIHVLTRESDLGERTRVEAIGGAISRTGRGRPRRGRVEEEEEEEEEGPG